MVYSEQSLLESNADINSLYKRINELEQALEVFKAREYEIRQSEAMFRRLLEEASDAIVLSDENGRISFVNSKVLHIFGYARDDLMGQPVEVLMPERYRQGHDRYRKLFLQNPSGREMGKGRYLVGLREDGTEISIEVGLSYVRLIGRVFIMSYIMDITERCKMEARITEQNQQFSRIFDYASATLENLTNAIQRDASKEELLVYLDDVTRQLHQLGDAPEPSR